MQLFWRNRNRSWEGQILGQAKSVKGRNASLANLRKEGIAGERVSLMIFSARFVVRKSVATKVRQAGMLLQEEVNTWTSGLPEMKQILYCGFILCTITRGGRRRWSTRWGWLAATTPPWTGKSWRVSRYLPFRGLVWWTGGMRWEESELRECSTGGGAATRLAPAVSFHLTGYPGDLKVPGQVSPISSNFSTGWTWTTSICLFGCLRLFCSGNY